jgi:hypothetical protein
MFKFVEFLKYNLRINRLILKCKPYIFSLVITFLILPFFTHSRNVISSKLNQLTPISDGFYTERIFHKTSEYFFVGIPKFYLNPEDSITTELVSLGESTQRFIYILSNYNMVFTYYFFATICLSLTYICLSKILNIFNNKQLYGHIFLVIALLIFFGNSSQLATDSFQFKRMISPQFHVTLWVFIIWLTQKLLLELSLKKISARNQLYLTFALILSLYIHYPYIFMATAIIFFYLLITLTIEFKSYKNSVVNLLILCIGCLPQIIVLLLSRNSQNYHEFSLRFGLIESRIPGSLYTIVSMIPVILISMILKNRMSSRLSSSQVVLVKTVILCASAVLISSQSNLVTNSSIQFSDHFNILSNIVLIIFFIMLISFVPNNFKNQRVDFFESIFSSRTKILLLVFLIITNLFTQSQHFFQSTSVNSFNTFQNKFDKIIGDHNLKRIIVDVPMLETLIGNMYSGSVLYSNNIGAYGFSNAEILSRYAVSHGCPRKLSAQEINEMFIYTFAAREQKFSRVKKLSETLGADYLVDYSDNLSLEIALEKENFVNSISNLLIADSKNCFERAKDYKIDAIIYDESSRWKIYFDNSDKLTYWLLNDIYVTLM